MADISATTTTGQGGSDYFWEQINDDDDGVALLVNAGEYSVTCEGDWTGSMQIDIQYGKTAAGVANVDTDLLRFTANGTANIKIGRGYIKPTRTNGSSGADVDVWLSPTSR